MGGRRTGVGGDEFSLSQPAAAATPPRTWRRGTQGRRVLLERLVGPRPPVPDVELLKKHMENVPGVRDLPGQDACEVFPFAENVVQDAEAVWVRAEAAKATLVRKDEEATELAERARTKFFDYLLKVEGDFVRSQREHRHVVNADPDTDMAAFCSLVLDAAMSYAQRTQERLHDSMSSAREEEEPAARRPPSPSAPSDPASLNLTPQFTPPPAMQPHEFHAAQRSQQARAQVSAHPQFKLQTSVVCHSCGAHNVVPTAGIAGGELPLPAAARPAQGRREQTESPARPAPDTMVSDNSASLSRRVSDFGRAAHIAPSPTTSPRPPRPPAPGGIDLQLPPYPDASPIAGRTLPQPPAHATGGSRPQPVRIKRASVASLGGSDYALSVTDGAMSPMGQAWAVSPMTAVPDSVGMNILNAIPPLTPREGQGVEERRPADDVQHKMSPLIALTMATDSAGPARAPQPYSAAAYVMEKERRWLQQQARQWVPLSDPPRPALHGFDGELALLQPEYGDVMVGEDLLLSVACCVLEKLAPALGKYAGVMTKVRDVLIHKVYDTEKGAGQTRAPPHTASAPASHTMYGRATHYLSLSPFYASAHAARWENNALAEELERAKFHMKLWGWSIWRNVVKGMKYYSGVLRRINMFTDRRHNRIVMSDAWQQWRAHVMHARAVKRVELARAMLMGYAEEGELEDRIVDILAAVDEQQEMIAVLRADLKTVGRTAAELRDEVERLRLRIKCKETTALDAVTRQVTTAELLAAETKRVENLTSQVRLLRKVSTSAASDRWNESDGASQSELSHRRSRTHRSFKSNTSVRSRKEHRMASMASMASMPRRSKARGTDASITNTPTIDDSPGP